MDFANLDLRAASERGSWVELHLNGEPIDTEKPPRIRIKGMGAKSVTSAFKKVERVQTLRAERMARTADKDADVVLAKFQDELEAAMAALIVASVVEWENIEWNGEPLEVNEESVLKVCGPGTLFFWQVNSAIAEDRRLFTNADSA